MNTGKATYGRPLFPKHLLLCILATTLLAGGPVQAQESPRSLRGTDRVYVVVGASLADAERYGFTLPRIQGYVEEKIREAGFSVMNKKEWSTSDDMAMFYVEVSLVKNRLGFYAYSITAHFHQQVSLVRSPSIKTDAITWRTPGTLGITRGNELQTTIQTYLDDVINKFISAHRHANGT